MYHVRFTRICNRGLFPHIFAAYFEKNVRVFLTCLISTFFTSLAAFSHRIFDHTRSRVAYNSGWFCLSVCHTSCITRVGVTRGGNWRSPLFFPLKKPADLFFPEKNWRSFFCSSLSLSLISLVCHAPGMCHPAPFLPVRPYWCTVLCNSATKKFFPLGVHSLEGVTPPPLPRFP